MKRGRPGERNKKVPPQKVDDAKISAIQFCGLKRRKFDQQSLRPRLDVVHCQEKRANIIGSNKLVQNN